MESVFDLFPSFHDAVRLKSNNVAALQQVASTLNFSTKDEKHKDFLSMLSHFYQLLLMADGDGRNLKKWLEESYEYPGKEPVDPGLLARADRNEQSHSVASNEQAAYRNLYHMVRAGKLVEAYDYCLHVLQRSWLAIVIQPAISDKEHNNNVKNSRNNNMNDLNDGRSLWKATLTSIACSGEKWQRAFYGALVGDLPSVQAVSEHPLDLLWAYVNSNNLDAFRAPDVSHFCGFYAQICACLFKKNFSQLQSCFDTFIGAKEVLDLEVVVVALMGAGLQISFDTFWQNFISLWLASSEEAHVECTIYKFPFVALIKDHVIQERVLSEVLFEECLTLDRSEIFRVSTNCKKYCPLSFESALQLMFQRALGERDLDASMLQNLTHFTAFPLLAVDRFALELTAAISRRFLVSQNIALLKSLISSVDPKDLLRYENPLVRELACYTHLVRVLLVYDEWREELLKQPSVREASQGFERILWERQHAHWQHEMATLADMVRQAYAAATSIGWLELAELKAKDLLLTSESQREAELAEAHDAGSVLMHSIMRNIEQ